MIVGATAYIGSFQFLRNSYKAFNWNGRDILLFQNQQPSVQDWKHKEVIQKICELKKREPYSRVVIVSNAPHFHSTSLNLTLKYMGIHDFSFNSTSKQRWFEFAEFILVKTGQLGPPESITDIEPVADFILKSPPSWFQNVYQEVGRWPLPDGTEAVLFHVNPKPKKGVAVGSFNIGLDELKLPNILIHKVQVQVDPGSPKDFAVGKIKEMSIACEKVTYKFVTLQDVKIRFVHPHINVPRFVETNEIHLLNLDRLVWRFTRFCPATCWWIMRVKKPNG